MDPAPKSALELTAENLRASIAVRKATPQATDDFRAVTANEEARLREVEAAISSATKPAAASK
jgi:hypothetical protein